MQATAPGHVATARRYVIDALTPDQIAQLTQICDALLTRLDPQGAMIDVYNRYDPRPTTDSGARP